MGTRGRYALATALGLMIGCTAAPAFVCSDSSECKDGSFTGVCEDNGYCSFGDPGCDSGRRFGDHASGDLAGTCVGAEGTSTGAAITSGGEATLDGASLEQSSLDESSSDGSTTTGDGASSTGKPLDDTGNSDTTTTSTSSGETGASDTMTMTGCGGMDPVDECSACVYENCCDELLACATDEVCTCFFQCQSMMGMTMELCLELCGPSMVLETVNACMAMSCEMLCVFD